MDLKRSSEKYISIAKTVKSHIASEDYKSAIDIISNNIISDEYETIIKNINSKINIRIEMIRFGNLFGSMKNFKNYDRLVRATSLMLNTKVNLTKAEKYVNEINDIFGNLIKKEIDFDNISKNKIVLVKQWLNITHEFIKSIAIYYEAYGLIHKMMVQLDHHLTDTLDRLGRYILDK